MNAEVAWADAERIHVSVGRRAQDRGLVDEAVRLRRVARSIRSSLYIHGGPHSDYNEGWFDEFQNLAGAGMFVLFTNPRGSSGTNTEFTYASRGDWGGKDYDDLMKAVDIVAKRPDVDSTRMGVTGGSYGGFMTAWVTTKTNRFKAAETDRMISEWTYWYGASDAQGLTEGEFFGKPWENQIMYDTLSPIRYVKKVKTPTLIVQSEEDYPHADRQRRALVHGAEEAGRAGGVRSLSALEPRSVAHRRAVAARRPTGPPAAVVRPLAQGKTSKRGGNAERHRSTLTDRDVSGVDVAAVDVMFLRRDRRRWTAIPRCFSAWGVGGTVPDLLAIA